MAHSFDSYRWFLITKVRHNVNKLEKKTVKAVISQERGWTDKLKTLNKDFNSLQLWTRKMMPTIFWIAYFIVSLAAPIAPQGLDFTLYTCTSPGNCQPEQTILLADYFYVCEDPITCNKVQENFHSFIIHFNLKFIWKWKNLKITSI